MNMFMSEQIFINEKGQIEGLKDGCLSYLEKLLALKDNTNLVLLYSSSS